MDKHIEQPQRDLMDEILTDHNHIKQLFAACEASHGDALKLACQHLFRKLAVHETAEEIVVHPLTGKAPGGRQVVEERLAEEQQAKTFIARLEHMDVTTREFTSLLASLKAAVLAHAEREETQELLLIREVIDGNKLRRLATAYRAAEAVAPTHAHPGLPSSATANLLLGPLASLIDRTRDALQDALDRVEP